MEVSEITDFGEKQRRQCSMNELVVRVENINGILVTTSNRVAEELGVEHKNLLAKIDDYVEKFGGLTFSREFYIESTFENRGKQYRNYLITKKGIAQLIGGYSSAVEKAFELNVAYINRFEEMEEYIKNPYKNISTQDAVIIAFQEQKKIIERVDIIEKKVENEIRVDNGEQRRIQKAVNIRVYQRIDILNNKQNSKLMFQAIHRDLKDRFGVASYRDIKRSDLEDVLLFISTWIEPAELKRVTA